MFGISFLCCFGVRKYLLFVVLFSAIKPCCDDTWNLATTGVHCWGCIQKDRQHDWLFQLEPLNCSGWVDPGVCTSPAGFRQCCGSSEYHLPFLCCSRTVSPMQRGECLENLYHLRCLHDLVHCDILNLQCFVVENWPARNDDWIMQTWLHFACMV